MPRASAFAERLHVASSFARTRWRLNFRDRRALEAYQQRALHRFLAEIAPRAPRFRGRSFARIEDVPAMDKAAMMADFCAYNTLGITHDEAMAVALEAERSRDFSPAIGDATVGLSSGTSGRRGLFLVSSAERMQWAGAVLARMLPAAAIGRIATPWMPPIRIAFFLRANSNLYRTVASRRIEFRFFDLTAGLAGAAVELNAWKPDALIAPPTVLAFLAAQALDGRLAIAPEKVISVAEVLEDADARSVRAAFGCATDQIYQATEGFLGYTCERGSLHLNEALMHVETEWLDAAKTRFHPVITDFSRHAQLIVRYRLDDILRAAPHPCACGRAERTIAAIEGRADEIVSLPLLEGGEPAAIFPDALRHAVAGAGESIEHYAIDADGDRWRVAIEASPEASFEGACREAETALRALCRRHRVRAPAFAFARWSPPKPGEKRRRIAVRRVPEDAPCA
ncbi:MAG TPA: F390 synthetase-related protein [Candidatus Acidoferrales bacterium]|nr:F390 synthetase-related protein [Candidatus Acidoferrales bacterium]